MTIRVGAKKTKGVEEDILFIWKRIIEITMFLQIYEGRFVLLIVHFSRRPV